MDFSLFHMWQQMGMVAKSRRRHPADHVDLCDRHGASNAGSPSARAPPVGRLRRADPAADRRTRRGCPSCRASTATGRAARSRASSAYGVDEFVRGVDELGPRVGGSRRGRAGGRRRRPFDEPRQGARDRQSKKRGLSALATISSSAPFVGLFGTVFGIITAFQNMADPSKGGGGLATVSAGISEALLTTAVGLAVAIVSVWFYNYFINRVDDSPSTSTRPRARCSTPWHVNARRRRDGGRLPAHQRGISLSDGKSARLRLRRARKHARAREPRRETGKIRAEINVTPLVDVVLVLLIIFMVVTPIIASGVPGRAAAHRAPRPQARRRQGHHHLGDRRQANLHVSATPSPTPRTSPGWSRKSGASTPRRPRSSRSTSAPPTARCAT